MPRSPWEASTVQCCLPPTVTRVMLPKQGRAAACLACPKCPWLANFVLRLVFKSNITSWVHRTDAEREHWHTHALRTRRARSAPAGSSGRSRASPAGARTTRRAAAGDCAAAPHCAQSVRRAAYGTATTRSRARTRRPDTADTVRTCPSHPLRRPLAELICCTCWAHILSRSSTNGNSRRRTRNTLRVIPDPVRKCWRVCSPHRDFIARHPNADFPPRPKSLMRPHAGWCRCHPLRLYSVLFHSETERKLTRRVVAPMLSCLEYREESSPGWRRACRWQPGAGRGRPGAAPPPHNRA